MAHLFLLESQRDHAKRGVRDTGQRFEGRAVRQCDGSKRMKRGGVQRRVEGFAPGGLFAARRRAISRNDPAASLSFQAPHGRGQAYALAQGVGKRRGELPKPFAERKHAARLPVFAIFLPAEQAAQDRPGFLFHAPEVRESMAHSELGRVPAVYAGDQRVHAIVQRFGSETPAGEVGHAFL